MKKTIIFASLLALFIPGAAFAGSSTDAALGLGAFAVFNQIISGTGVFGAFAPAPRPVYLPAPAPPVAPVVVYHAPVHYRPVYRAPARVVVIEKRVVVAPRHGFIPPGHTRNGHPGRGWR